MSCNALNVNFRYYPPVAKNVGFTNSGYLRSEGLSF
jgi:hypothetical protein